jgi:lipoprotein
MEIKEIIKNKKVVYGLIATLLLGCGVGYYVSPLNQSKEESVVELKKAQDNLSKVADQEVIAINKRLTNDQLSDLSAAEILSKYTPQAQSEINKLFEGADKSRDYALTLIGKVIPTTTIKTFDEQSVTLNRKTILVILNTGEKSKSFVEQLNKVDTLEGVNYLVIFPSETNDKIAKFVEETKLNTDKFKVATLTDNQKTATQPDLLGIAEYYFNAKGVPSYVSIVSNSITFAGSGNTEKMFDTFLKKAFTEPYLYNEIQ